VEPDAALSGLAKGKLELGEETAPPRDGDGHTSKFAQQLVTGLNRDAASPTDCCEDLEKALLTMWG
jgi:hypothetical protein